MSPTPSDSPGPPGGPRSLLKLGTRMSVLALAQAGQVAAELERLTGVPVERVGIETEGDRMVDQSLTDSRQGPLAKGWFTGAIEDAIRAGRVDFAVHSLKDLPVADSEGLSIVIPRREDAADLLLSRKAIGGPYAAGAFAAGAFAAGASSPRRIALLARWFPAAEGRFLRGNVTTRITRLREGRFDAILLAASGMRRLAEGSAWAPANSSLADARADGVQVLRLPPRAWPGAPGQGALALQYRSDDIATRDLLMALEHAPTRRAVGLERDALSALGTGCALPFGAWVAGDLASFAVELDGRMVVGECSASDLPAIVGQRDAIMAHTFNGELTLEEWT